MPLSVTHVSGLNVTYVPGLNVTYVPGLGVTHVPGLYKPHTPRGKGMLPVGVTHRPTPGGPDFNKPPRIASCATVSHNGEAKQSSFANGYGGQGKGNKT